MSPDQVKHLTNLFLHHHDRQVYHQKLAAKHNLVAKKYYDQSRFCGSPMEVERAHFGKYNFHAILGHHHSEQALHHEKTKRDMSKILERSGH